MFKRIAQKLIPRKRGHFDRVRIEYGQILSQDDCEGILFFMHPNLEWGGALNHAVLKAAGGELDSYITENVITPRSGQVFTLPALGTSYKSLFLAILADWDGGNGFEERDLLNCYRRCIEQAEAQGVKTIAVPAMGRDKRDFPHIRFARLALQGLLEKLDDRIEYVKIMCVDRTMMDTYMTQMDKLKRRAD